MDNEAVKEIVGGLLKLGESIGTSVAPAEARRHFRNAGREFLQGMISMLDAADEKDGKKQSSEAPKEKNTSHTIDIDG